MSQNICHEIYSKALEIGYLNCGILPLEEALEGYTEHLDARYAYFPDDKEFKAEDNYKMAHPEIDYPWAKSVIICTVGFSDYHLPESYYHRIGRLYAFDYRHEKDAEEHIWESQFSDFLSSNNIRIAHSPDRGIIPLRHVAEKAGLGIIRKNNFLFTEEHGSFVSMSAWLIDRSLRLVQTREYKACPSSCHRCMDACPTKSLTAPYTMHRRTCVSPLTCKYPEGADITKGDIGLHFDGWLYGCDLCQEACPFNRKVLNRPTKRDFPRQDEFAPYIDPEKILSIPDEYLEEHFQPRFWYMPKGSTWKWKANAMCALIADKNPKADQLITPFLNHENPELQKTAAWALKQINHNHFC